MNRRPVLDVTVEAAVLDLVNDMRKKFGTSLIYITHNLGIVAKVCERVGVMYLGDMVEEALVNDLFASPHHPYTRRLMSCVPRLDGNKHTTSFLADSRAASPAETCGRRVVVLLLAVRAMRSVGVIRTVPVDQVSKSSFGALRPLARNRCLRDQDGGDCACPATPGDRPVLDVQEPG